MPSYSLTSSLISVAISLFLLIGATCVSSITDACFQRYDSYVLGHINEVITDSRKLKCADMCSRMEWCLALRYRAATKTCQLISVSSTVLAPDPEWPLFIKKSSACEESCNSPSCVCKMENLNATCITLETCRSVYHLTTTSGAYTIRPIDRNIPVYCDLDSDALFMYTYVLPFAGNDSFDLAPLFDVTDEVIIRYKRGDGLQFVARITKLTQFAGIPISVQMNQHVGYGPIVHTEMGPFLFLGINTPQEMAGSGKGGWFVEGSEIIYTLTENTTQNYFVLLYNSARNDYIVNSYAPFPQLMSAWIDLAVESLTIIPDECFTPYYEVHFGGGGGRGFGNDYPWRKGVAFGLKSTKT